MGINGPLMESYNATAHFTVFNMYFEVDNIYVYDTFSSGNYKIKFAVMFSRIYKTHGDRWTKDYEYEDGLGDNEPPSSDYSHYNGDGWDFQGGEYDLMETDFSGMHSNSRHNCYGRKPWGSDWNIRLFVMVISQYAGYHKTLSWGMYSYTANTWYIKSLYYGGAGFGGGLMFRYKVMEA